MPIKFLYIDDEESHIVDGIKNNLSNANLQIDTQRAKSWNEQITTLIADLPNYDGLLLDLKLEFSLPGQTLTHYAPALAQEIRTRIKKNDLRDIPIILCSTDTNFAAYYDSTSQDLFDACLNKSNISQDDTKTFIAHAEAYKSIAESPDDLDNLLAAPIPDYLDDIRNYFKPLKSIHEKASFLLNQVIEPTGIFIDEDILAIRLGIDKTISTSTAWDELVTKLAPYKYTGIYANMGTRWWERGIDSWWRNHFPNEKRLPILTAQERVALLLYSIPNLQGLVALDNPNNHLSTKYWRKCELSKRPLDDIDGLLYAPTSQYTWQDARFVACSYLPDLSQTQLAKLIDDLLPQEIRKLNNILSKIA